MNSIEYQLSDAIQVNQKLRQQLVREKQLFNWFALNAGIIIGILVVILITIT